MSRLGPLRSFSSAILPKHSNSTPPSPSPTQAQSSRIGNHISHVEKVRRKLEQHIREMDTDGLYQQFWRICQTESIENQKQIWSRSRLKQSSIYRMFNNPKKPVMTRASQPIVKVLYNPKSAGDDEKSSTASSIDKDPNTQNSSQYLLHFVSSSHPARLLQMHHYFETVLDIPAGSDARLALIVACCSYGDMFMAERLFRDFRSRAGEEMYGAMIRGWISKTNRRLEVPGSITEDQARLNKRRAARVNSALELFYEMQQRGIVPSFETYHTLTIGLATFKNDLEAAELMLQHMILRKGKPYVQVLHILLREYGRRGDFSSMMRIFSLYDEYGIRLKPISANLLLKAVFQLRDDQVRAILDHSAEQQPQQHHLTVSSSDKPQGVEDPLLQFRRRQIAHIRSSLSKQSKPDAFMFSTLIYGYGHLSGAQADLDQAIKDLQRSNIPMTTVLWTSIVMAYVGQHQLRQAETALDEALKWFKDQVLTKDNQDKTTTPTSTSSLSTRRGWKAEATAARQAILPIPRGVFHAVMVGMIESMDVAGMERTVARMMDLHDFCEKHEAAIRRQAEHSQGATVWRGSRQHEADEYTANILLLGYLMAKDVDKARRVAHQIAQHPSWETRRGHAGIEALKEYVFSQATKNTASVMQAIRGEDDEDAARTHHAREHDVNHANTEPIELDDDVEIDIEELTRQLRSTLREKIN
ncbi:hypothetical protein BGW41_000640 [Actinomortierella wolfii]|nr:hypothetical protein BGW41_000640 [Actinomortierella wolfii]